LKQRAASKESNKRDRENATNCMRCRLQKTIKSTMGFDCARVYRVPRKVSK